MKETLSQWKRRALKAEADNMTPNKFMQSIVTPPKLNIKHTDFENYYVEKKHTRIIKSGFLVEFENIRQHKS